MGARVACLLPLLLLIACGTVRGGALSGAEESRGGGSSPYAAAVAPLAGSVDFSIYVPDALPPDLIVTASLYGAPSPVRGQATLGAPVLRLEFTKLPNGKPVLSLTQGRDGCCQDFSGQTPTSSVMIRTVAPSAGAPSSEVRGQLFAPRGVADGGTLRWQEPSGTQIVMAGYTFGEFSDEQALLTLARSMRALPHPTGVAPLLAYWSTHESHSPAGHRVFIAVRSAPLPESARLIDPNGTVYAAARFDTPQTYECLAAAAGVARFAVPLDVLRKFGSGQFGPTTGYRAEVLIGGTWRPVQLVAGPCFSIEYQPHV